MFSLYFSFQERWLNRRYFLRPFLDRYFRVPVFIRRLYPVILQGWYSLDARKELTVIPRLYWQLVVLSDLISDLTLRGWNSSRRPNRSSLWSLSQIDWWTVVLSDQKWSRTVGQGLKQFDLAVCSYIGSLGIVLHKAELLESLTKPRQVTTT